MELCRVFQDEGCAPGGQPVGTAGDILPAARGAAPQQEDQHQHHHGLRAAEPRGRAQAVRGEALSGAEAGRGSHTPALHQAGECKHNFDITVHCFQYSETALVVLHRCQNCDTPCQERRLWRQTGGRWRWSTRDCSSLGSRREVKRCRADKRIRRCVDRKLSRGKFAEKKSAWLACIQK